MQSQQAAGLNELATLMVARSGEWAAFVFNNIQ